MNRHWMAAIVVWGFLVSRPPTTQAADETTRYADQGISFTYPKDWKEKTDKKANLVIINVKDDRGSQFLAQLYAPSIPPKLILTQMDKTFRKIFEGKLVKGSDRATKHKLLGAEREGQTMEFEIVKGVTSKIEMYAFALPSRKKTLFVMFQNSSTDADAAKKNFSTIANSLEETKPK